MSVLVASVLVRIKEYDILAPSWLPQSGMLSNLSPSLDGQLAAVALTKACMFIGEFSFAECQQFVSASECPAAAGTNPTATLVAKELGREEALKPFELCIFMNPTCKAYSPNQAAAQSRDAGTARWEDAAPVAGRHKPGSAAQ